MENNMTNTEIKLELLKIAFELSGKNRGLSDLTQIYLELEKLILR